MLSLALDFSFRPVFFFASLAVLYVCFIRFGFFVCPVFVFVVCVFVFVGFFFILCGSAMPGLFVVYFCLRSFLGL